MLKKYLSKFTIDILPSIMATVVGAYIVNVYIIPKTREDRPPAPAAAQSAPAPEKAAAKPAEAAAVDATEPAPNATRKAADKPVEKAATDKADKSDTAAKTDVAKTDTKAAEPRRHAPAREKAVAKADPGKAEPAAPAPAPTPVLATVGTAPSGDANDLARAAIERLNRSEKVEAPRAPERTAAVQPQPASAPAPVQQAQPMQQLPPPIVVSNPSVEDAAPVAQSRGPHPPGDVPVPMREMQANAEERGGRTNVVEDVLSGAKSMFDKVIPRPFER